MDSIGLWKANIADDDTRRVGVGLDHDDSAWPVVNVPGHWRSTPDFAESDGPLLYRHRFHLEPPAPGRRAFVTLEGVLYQADVWLDGAYLGDPEGYFFPHTFDITSLARLGADHVLAVEVACSPQRSAKSKRNITGALQSGEELDPEHLPLTLQTPGIRRATGVLEIMAHDTTERDQYEARLKYQRDQSCFIETAWEDGLEVGIGRGLERGRVQGLEQGLVRGREEGLERGREQGQLGQTRELILRIGSKRLGVPPSDVASELAGISDLDRLNALADRILDCSTWESLLKQD